MMTFPIAVASVLALLSSSACQSEPKVEPVKKVAPKVVRITASPGKDPIALTKRYAPLVSYLSTALGMRVEYRPFASYRDAAQALAAGEVDFAWTSGFGHVRARVAQQVLPVAMRAIDRELQSVFFTHVESGVEKVEDIKGKTVAFGSQGSTSGHLMPRHFLIEQFAIDPETDLAAKPTYNRAYKDIAKSVEEGRVAVGVVSKKLWEQLQNNKQLDTSKTKLIWTSPAYVDSVWTARKAVEPAVRERFKQALLALKLETKGHAPVLHLQGAKKFVPAAPADFDAIEQAARRTGLVKDPSKRPKKGKGRKNKTKKSPTTNPG